MITLPLALATMTAGLVGGVHCVGMCGGISTLLSHAPNDASNNAPERALASGKNKVIAIHSTSKFPAAKANSTAGYRHQILLQSGRLLTYMLIGMLFGGIGAAGLQFKPYLPVQKILFVIGNLALVLLGLHLLGLTFTASLLRKISGPILQFGHAFMPAIAYGRRHSFLMGMSWGCLPCGLLYGVAPFALLSGDAFSGAILMLLFGLTALPHLLFTQTLLRRSNSGQFAAYFRAASACCLIFIGLFGLWYFDMGNMPSFLCVTPIA
ncbi:MAG: sulfite exporter TauE/SafE family protein [Pseudomonadota bacterium]